MNDAVTKHLVVSAVNLVEGGTLEILRQCLRSAALVKGWRVTAIVNDPEKVGIVGVTYIARPDVKPSWLKRIRFEYIECGTLAKELCPDFWLSLHDMTPSLGNLTGKVPQAVYCHNAMCFYRMNWREIFLDPNLLLFSKFYSFFYRFNILNNRSVVVQQSWMREAFKEQFGCRNVIVAHPAMKSIKYSARVREGSRFFYPSFARVFKNFEVVLSAWEILCADPSWDGRLTLTVDESVNRYGHALIKRFGHLRNVEFIGRVAPEKVQELYRQNDCLVFASKLETWGLPITEAKEAGLFILAADLPYAHEAAGNYDGAAFFSPIQPLELAEMMNQFRYGRLDNFQGEIALIDEPFARDWFALLHLLLQSDGNSDMPKTL
jgi:glycosyltransferase involved in cell wall biosynthesis